VPSGGAFSLAQLPIISAIIRLEKIVIFINNGLSY